MLYVHTIYVWVVIFEFSPLFRTNLDNISFEQPRRPLDLVSRPVALDVPSKTSAVLFIK